MSITIKAWGACQIVGTPQTFVRAILVVFKLILQTTSSVIIE